MMVLTVLCIALAISTTGYCFSKDAGPPLLVRNVMYKPAMCLDNCCYSKFGWDVNSRAEPTLSPSLPERLHRPLGSSDYKPPA
jgi:hypothetical protein